MIKKPPIRGLEKVLVIKDQLILYTKTEMPKFMEVFSIKVIILLLYINTSK